MENAAYDGMEFGGELRGPSMIGNDDEIDDMQL